MGALRGKFRIFSEKCTLKLHISLRENRLYFFNNYITPTYWQFNLRTLETFFPHNLHNGNYREIFQSTRPINARGTYSISIILSVIGEICPTYHDVHSTRLISINRSLMLSTSFTHARSFFRLWNSKLSNLRGSENTFRNVRQVETGGATYKKGEGGRRRWGNKAKDRGRSGARARGRGRSREGPRFRMSESLGVREEASSLRGSLSPTFNFRQSRGARSIYAAFKTRRETPGALGRGAPRSGPENQFSRLKTAPTRFSRFTIPPHDIIRSNWPAGCEWESLRDTAYRVVYIKKESRPGQELNAHWHTRHFRLSHGGAPDKLIISDQNIILNL